MDEGGVAKKGNAVACCKCIWYPHQSVESVHVFNTPKCSYALRRFYLKVGRSPDSPPRFPPRSEPPWRERCANSETLTQRQRVKNRLLADPSVTPAHLCQEPYCIHIWLLYTYMYIYNGPCLCLPGWQSVQPKLAEHMG